MIQVRKGGLDHPAVRDLLMMHLTEMRGATPIENAHALDLGELGHPSIRFFSAWEDDRLIGVAAIKALEPGHAEVKSMRTAPAALRRGVGRLLLDHLLAAARARGDRRVSLETGTAPMFAPANAMYEAAGFRDGPVFGGYPASPHNRFLTMEL